MNGKYYMLEVNTEMVVESLFKFYKEYYLSRYEKIEDVDWDEQSIMKHHEYYVENKGEVYYLFMVDMYKEYQKEKYEISESDFLYPNGAGFEKRTSYDCSGFFESDDENILIDIKHVKDDELLTGLKVKYEEFISNLKGVGK